MVSVKEAITIRLEPSQMARLRAVAREQNRSLTNYVETAILRDLTSWDERSRVITQFVAPGVPDKIDRDDVQRPPHMTDEQYAAHQDFAVDLWSIPDCGTNE
jgi:hypothetical protein